MTEAMARHGTNVEEKQGMLQCLGTSDRYLQRLAETLSMLDRSAMDHGIAMIHGAWMRGAQLITLGNGGSSMTALHFCTDWSKMIPIATGRPFLGRSLVDNIGLLMAYGNDVSFDDVFVEQLKNILRPNDLVVALSGSGNSENVIRAVDYANANGAETLGLCGLSGGRLKEKSKHSIWVCSNDMQICEDVHAIFGHIVMQALCVKDHRSVQLVATGGMQGDISAVLARKVASPGAR